MKVTSYFASHLAANYFNYQTFIVDTGSSAAIKYHQRDAFRLSIYKIFTFLTSGVLTAVYTA